MIHVLPTNTEMMAVLTERMLIYCQENNLFQINVDVICTKRFPLNEVRKQCGSMDKCTMYRPRIEQINTRDSTETDWESTDQNDCAVC